MKHTSNILNIFLFILIILNIYSFYNRNTNFSNKENIYLKNIEIKNEILKKKSDSISEYIKLLNNKDTIIKYKYKTKYKFIYKASKKELLKNIKDSLQILKNESLEDSTSLIKINKSIIQLNECNELLNNCLETSIVKDTLINIKDSIISNQDSIIIKYKYKNKKLKNKNTLLKVGAFLIITFESILLIKK